MGGWGWGLHILGSDKGRIACFSARGTGTALICIMSYVMAATSWTVSRRVGYPGEHRNDTRHGELKSRMEV